MTDTEHVPLEPGSDAPQEAAHDAADERRAAASRPSRGPWFILLLLLLLAAGAGYWWVTVVHPAERAALVARLDALEQADSAFGRELATRTTAVADEVAALGDTAQANASRLRALGQAQEDLSASVKSLFAKDQQVALDWVLAEAEYLVFAATQRLALEHDAATALSALRAADERLRAAKHPDLIGLRDHLARDIAALEAVDQPDVEGLALYLANAITGLDQLPTRPIADIDTSFTHMEDARIEPDNWQGVAKALWADLVSLVEVKDGALSDGVLFDPELRYFLAQNLRLELASARLAVLRRDAENFRAAATLVSDLLRTYYDTDNGAVKALIARLEAARGLTLDPPLPSIAGSLDALREARAGLADVALVSDAQ
ncbi:MAG: uroporphyrinogen-III C-methyltransferase [Gammaproteobacteria bacterium]